MGIFFKCLNRCSCQVTVTSVMCVESCLCLHHDFLVGVRSYTCKITFFDNVFTEKLSSSIQPITFSCIFSFDIVCGRSQLCEKTNDKIPVFVILKNYASTCTLCLSNDSIEGKNYLPIFQFHITLKHVCISLLLSKHKHSFTKQVKP